MGTMRERAREAVRPLTDNMGVGRLKVECADAAGDVWEAELRRMGEAYLAERALADRLAYALAICAADINAPLVVEALDAHNAARPQGASPGTRASTERPNDGNSVDRRT